MRIERLLANLGYGKRKETTTLVKRGRVTLAASGAQLGVGDKALPAEVGWCCCCRVCAYFGVVCCCGKRGEAGRD